MEHTAKPGHDGEDLDRDEQELVDEKLEQADAPPLPEATPSDGPAPAA